MSPLSAGQKRFWSTAEHLHNLFLQEFLPLAFWQSQMDFYNVVFVAGDITESKNVDFYQGEKEGCLQRERRF